MVLDSRILLARCVPCRLVACPISEGDAQDLCVTVDESVREEDGSDNEEKDEDIESGVCQLLDQRTASQRRDKSCAPSH